MLNSSPSSSPGELKRTKRFRAHYDGKVIVPEEDVVLPVNESIDVEICAPLKTEAMPNPADMSKEERLAAFESLLKKIKDDPYVAPERWTRESFYEDDDEDES